MDLFTRDRLLSVVFLQAYFVRIACKFQVLYLYYSLIQFYFHIHIGSSIYSYCPVCMHGSTRRSNDRIDYILLPPKEGRNY